MKKSILIILFLFTSLLVNCQSNPSLLKEGVTSFFLREDDKWGSSHRVILYRNGQTIKGFAGWSAQAESPGYIEATLDGNTLSGKWISYYGGDEPISFQVAENSISTEWGFSGSTVVIPVEDENLFSYKTITIYEQPNFTSKVLVQDLDAENAGFSITEIGKMEPNPKYPEESNIWYKVKNSQYEGWVFGLINSL
jgi:hypothetical protein